MAGINRTTDKATDLITFSRASGGTYLDSDGLLKTASTNVPRIEYAADGTLKGLLIEEQRTNLVTYSEDFTDASWNKSTGFVSVTADAGVSPSGQSDATLFIPDTDTKVRYAGVSGFTSSTYTFSIYAKSNGGANDQISIWLAGVTQRAVFDLGDGTVNNINLTSASIEEVGNGWYRCVGYSSTATTSVRVYMQDGNAFAGNGSDGIYLWGAQLEAGSFPTSYIPTSGATATRAADIASISVDSFGYNQKEGTVVVEASKIGPATNSYTNLLIFRDTASGISNRAPDIGLGSGRGGTVGVTRIDVYDGGALQASLGDTSSFEVNTFYKAGAGLKKDNFASVLDGAITTTDTSGSVPSANKLDIGNRNFSNVLNGHIKSIQYYPRRLSNAQLQELTS